MQEKKLCHGEEPDWAGFGSHLSCWSSGWPFILLIYKVDVTVPTPIPLGVGSFLWKNWDTWNLYQVLSLIVIWHWAWILLLSWSVSLSVWQKVWLTLSHSPFWRSRVRSRFCPENKGNILMLDEAPCDLQFIFHPKTLPILLLKLILGRERFTYLVLHPNDTAFMSRDGY